MKRKWFHKRSDPLFLSLIVVLSLFFVSVLVASFSYLILNGNRTQGNFVAFQGGEEASLITKETNAEKAGLLKEQIRVGEISGEIVEIQENKIVFEAAVYEREKQVFAIVLDQREQLDMQKLRQSGGLDDDGLPEFEKTKISLEQLKAGDRITFRFPLEVPLTEIKNGTLEFEEIIVEDGDGSFEEELEQG